MAVAVSRRYGFPYVPLAPGRIEVGDGEMAWDAVAELSKLLERFRNLPIGWNCELLDAEWSSFRHDRLSEGGLWLPSPPESRQLVQGRVYLVEDESLSQPAFKNGRQARYSTVMELAAEEFRRLAIEGGGIITRIPQLQSELQPLVDGGGVGPPVDHERWWLAYLFRAAVPKIKRGDLNANGAGLKGLTYEVRVGGVFRASEMACEKLMTLLTSQSKSKVEAVDAAKKTSLRKSWLKIGPPPASWHQTSLVGQLKQIANWLVTSTKTLRANNGKTHWLTEHIGCDSETRWAAPFAIYFQTAEKFATVNGKRRVEADQYLKQEREVEAGNRTKDAKGNKGKRKEGVPKKLRPNSH